MRIIRSDQFDAMNRDAVRRFANEMVVRLRDFAPSAARELGDDGLRRFASEGIERAETRGFGLRGPVTLYIELMALFGREFDRDPMLPWASETLDDPDFDDEMERADALHELAIRYLDDVGGPDRSFFADALRRAANEPLDSPPVADAGFMDHAIERLGRIHPAKRERVDDDAMRALIDRARADAPSLGLGSDRGVVLLLGLMFVLGVGVAADPFHPWVREAIERPSFPNPDARAEFLSVRARALIREILAVS